MDKALLTTNTNNPIQSTFNEDTFINKDTIIQKNEKAIASPVKMKTQNYRLSAIRWLVLVLSGFLCLGWYYTADTANSIQIHIEE